MRFLALFLPLLLVMPAWAIDGDIPEAIQGKWVSQDEACDASGSTVIVSATTLVYADGRIDDVVYSPEEEVFRIREEGTAYEYVEADDRLIFRPEGFGMGSAFPMVRCPDLVSIGERRCGWLANLTPGNWSLVDRDRTWVLSGQGDDNAETIAVMDRVPAFDIEEFASTGSYYGYGCACLTVSTDSTLGRITAIASSQRLPLATCQADPSLPAIVDW